MKRLVLLATLMALFAAPAAAGGGGGDACVTVATSTDNTQDFPGAVFRGTDVLTVLEPDALGILQPTGEVLETNCTVALTSTLSFVPFTGTAVRRCENAAEKIQYTAFQRFEVVPLPDGPDGIPGNADDAFDGLINTSEIVQGTGRFNCGEDATGFNPITGQPDSVIKVSTFPGDIGRAIVKGLGTYCKCGTGKE